MTLAVSGLSYEYAPGTALAHKALSDITVSLAAGEVLLVMGSTGSGKTTLLRLLAGLLDPTSGTVEFEGGPVHAGSVGMVFQQPETQLFSETVLADVAFGPKNLGKSEEEAQVAARAALELVGLDPDEVGDCSPFQISGGQARRVAIAGVVAMEQPYILFDEPTAGLDGMGRAFVHRLVADLRARGVGVAIVSHDVEEFLGSVDRALLIDGGRMVWCGSMDDLVGDPALFEQAGLMVPDLLEFQRQLACMPGRYSLDVVKVASWAIAGFPAGGPGEHHHDVNDGYEGRGD